MYLGNERMGKGSKYGYANVSEKLRPSGDSRLGDIFLPIYTLSKKDQLSAQPVPFQECTRAKPAYPALPKMVIHKNHTFSHSPIFNLRAFFHEPLS